MALALSGLLVFGPMAIVAVQMVGPLQTAARHAQDNPANQGPPVALAHTVQAVRRFGLPVAGEVFAQTLTAPPGLRLERVDERVGERWEDSVGREHPRFCQQGSDLHLLWAARELTPRLRLHWVDAGGRRQVAEHRPDIAPAVSADFTPTFHSDGFDVVVPVPNSRVFFALARNAAGEPNLVAMGNALQPGERQGDCVMPGYRRARAGSEGPVIALAVVFRLPGGPPWIETFTRPAP
jgi:hypothetical protein